MNKKLISTLVAGLALSAVMTAPAHAFSLSIGGQVASQISVDTGLLVNAGLTSKFDGYGNVNGYINPLTNTATGPNAADVFIETFDAKATDPYARPLDSNSALVEFGGPNGGFTTLNSNTVANGGDLTVSGTMGIRNGTTGFAAAPGGNDQTYYAYGPGKGGPLPSSVNVNYSGLINYYNNFIAGNAYVDYLGVFYGSVDTYNEIQFFKKDGTTLTGSGLLSDGKLTGTEILTAMGCTDLRSFAQGGCSGAQNDSVYSNVYVNLSFLSTEQFGSFSFVTSDVAFEIDNVVTHVAHDIPEPGSMALVGLGLMGLSALRRRKQA